MTCAPCLQPPPFVAQEVQGYRGPWPDRVYLGMGGREFSGARGGEGAQHDAQFPQYLQALFVSLTQHGGLGPDRLAWTLDEEVGGPRRGLLCRGVGALPLGLLRWG